MERIRDRYPSVFTCFIKTGKTRRYHFRIASIRVFSSKEMLKVRSKLFFCEHLHDLQDHFKETVKQFI
jgi:ferredoxin-fold anticodon binding domain-containing protein